MVLTWELSVGRGETQKCTYLKIPVWVRFTMKSCLTCRALYASLCNLLLSNDSSWVLHKTQLGGRAGCGNAMQGLEL